MNEFERAKEFFIEGLKSLEANNCQAAENQFVQSLALVPDRVSTLNNLAAVKIRLEKFAEAEALARRAAVLEENSQEAWTSLGFALTQLARHAEALAACDLALKLNPRRPEALYAKSLALKELNRPEEAKTSYLQSLEMRMASSPLFSAPRLATQKAEILIVNGNPVVDISLKSFENLHVGQNFPGQIVRRLHEHFHFTYAFRDDVARCRADGQIPPPDLIINNDTNAEALASQGNHAELCDLIDGIGAPVVNHPAKIMQTARDAAAKLLDQIPGIKMPRTERFSTAGISREDLVREIEARFDYPLITRTLTAQEGKGMTKVDNRESLDRALSSGLPENFFVTAFFDSRNGSELFRKVRAAVVGEEIIFIRVDYDTNWNVHGRKTPPRAAFYLKNPALLALEKQICAAPEKELGVAAVQALRAIRERIPLDVFGIDFDVNADGTLVFYEANATMNLFSTARAEIDHPQDAENRLKSAMRNYFNSRMARR